MATFSETAFSEKVRAMADEANEDPARIESLLCTVAIAARRLL